MSAGLIAAAAALVLVACGGGGSSGSPAAAPGASTTISGTAVKGPIGNASVNVKNAATGVTLATTTTSVTGSYQVTISFNGDVIVEITGGSYTDESTGAVTTLVTPLRAVLTAAGGTATAHVTPLTTLAFNYSQSGGTVTAAAFTRVAAALASQFRLGEVNLVTTRPDPANPENTYGLALKALSKYLDSNSVTLQTLLTQAFTQADWTAFSTAYSNAYLAANGSTVTFNFDGSALNIGGTGAGGGSGTCGVRASGTVTAGGLTVPVNLDYCITGIAAGSCTAGNSSLNQSLSGQNASGANLTYTYSSSCASGAIAINLN